MDHDRLKPVTVEGWSYKEKDTLDPKAFFGQINQHLSDATVISFGEIHDENKEQDSLWIRRYQDEIVTALEKYVEIQDIVTPVPVDTIKSLLGQSSTLLAELDKQKTNFSTLRGRHPSRLFALAILPLATINRFTDIVLEGLEPLYFRHILENKLSKDVTGDLLKCLIAMLGGLRIHGVNVSGSMFSDGSEVGDDLFSKTVKITDSHPEAKVLIYGGAAHNLTDPGDLSISGPFGPVKLASLSYAPRAIAKWRERYQSIDLFSRNVLERTPKIEETIYGKMMIDSNEGEIASFVHKSGQVTYIIS